MIKNDQKLPKIIEIDHKWSKNSKIIKNYQKLLKIVKNVVKMASKRPKPIGALRSMLADTNTYKEWATFAICWMGEEHIFQWSWIA